MRFRLAVFALLLTIVPTLVVLRNEFWSYLSEPLEFTAQTNTSPHISKLSSAKNGSFQGSSVVAEPLQVLHSRENTTAKISGPVPAIAGTSTTAFNSSESVQTPIKKDAGAQIHQLPQTNNAQSQTAANLVQPQQFLGHRNESATGSTSPGGRDGIHSSFQGVARPLPFLFYALDSTTSPGTKQLRAAARETWLQDVRASGDDYRFFYFLTAPPPGGRRLLEDDVVVVPEQFWHEERYTRERNLLTFTMRWTLNHSVAPYIVKPDHDMFICHYHLRTDLSQRPSTKFFMGYFFVDTENYLTCRADQSLLIYSRDVVSLAVDKFERAHINLYRKSAKDPLEQSTVQKGKGIGFQIRNWAQMFGRLARHLWAKGELTVVDDTDRVDSVQGWHGMKVMNPCIDGTRGRNRCMNYCDNHIGYHVITKNPKIFFDLWKWRGNRASNFSAGLPSSPPACFDKSWASEGSPCATNWMKC